MPAYTAKNKYASQAVGVGITLTGLASSATDGRESALVDFRDLQPLRISVEASITLANSGTLGNDKNVYIYAYPVYPDTAGVDFIPGNAAGVDAAIAGIATTACKLIDSIDYTTINQTQKRTLTNIQGLFGSVPPKMGFIVRDYTGASISDGTISVSCEWDELSNA